MLHWLALNCEYTDSTNWINWVIKKGKIYEAGKKTVEGPGKVGGGGEETGYYLRKWYAYTYETIKEYFLRNWEYLLK